MHAQDSLVAKPCLEVTFLLLPSLWLVGGSGIINVDFVDAIRHQYLVIVVVTITGDGLGQPVGVPSFGSYLDLGPSFGTDFSLAMLDTRLAKTIFN